MPHQCTTCARQFADGSKEMLSGCPDCGGNKFQFMPEGGAPAAETPPPSSERDAGTVTETVGHVATKLRDFVGDNPTTPTTGRSGTPPDSDTDATAEAGLVQTPRGADAVEQSAETDASDRPTSADQVVDESDAVTGMEPADADRTMDDPTEQSVPEVDADFANDAAAAPASLPEDGAQSMARSEMVNPEELPGEPSSVGSATEASVRVDGENEAEATGRVVDTPSSHSPDLSELREELNDQFEGIRICERGQYELNLMELYEREETIIALQENGRYVIEPPESWRNGGD